MSLTPCTHCFMRYPDETAPAGRENARRFLHPNMAMNPLSRRDGTYICEDCGRAEGMADMAMPGARPRSDEEQRQIDAMMRLAVYNDRCEGRRFPGKGFHYGASGTPCTSEFITGEKDPYADYCPNCGSLFAFGYICTECHSVREDVMTFFEDHPKSIEMRKLNEEDAERERQDRERAKLRQEANEYIGNAQWRNCPNCGKESLMQREDYICLACRAPQEVTGPLLAHVLERLKERG